MAQRPPRTDDQQFFSSSEAVKADQVVHIKEIKYPLWSKDTENRDLPLMSAEVVKSRDGKKGSKLCVSAEWHLESAIDFDYLRDRDR